MSFVDTNVLAYATATSAPFRDRARAALVRLAADEQLSVSLQILREYVAVMTRPQTWGRALSLAEAMTDAAVFERRFTILEDGQLVWDPLMDLSRLYSFRGSPGPRRQCRRDHAGAWRTPAADFQRSGFSALHAADRSYYAIKPISCQTRSRRCRLAPQKAAGLLLETEMPRLR